MSILDTEPKAINPIAKHGEIGKGRLRPDNKKNVSSKHGNSKQYRIAKLKREFGSDEVK